MTRTRAIVLAIVALLAVGGVGLWFAYDQVLSGDAVPALTLPSAAPSATADAGAATADPAVIERSGRDGDRCGARWAVTAASLAGDWTLVTDASTAGYRVRERLAQLSADSDAVGRSTSGVTGTATLALSRRRLQVTAANDRRRHDHDRVRPQPARQPDAQRGPADRQLPDRVLHAHRRRSTSPPRP